MNRYQFFIAGDERLDKLDLLLCLRAAQQGAEMPDHILDSASCLATSDEDLQEQIESGVAAGQAREASAFSFWIEYAGYPDDALEALNRSIFEGELFPAEMGVLEA